jgi:hypothetical protein
MPLFEYDVSIVVEISKRSCPRHDFKADCPHWLGRGIGNKLSVLQWSGSAGSRRLWIPRRVAEDVGAPEPGMCQM